jgi:hypothetical protein
MVAPGGGLCGMRLVPGGQWVVAPGGCEMGGLFIG